MFCVVFTGQLVDWLTIFLSGYNYKYVCEQVDLNYWRNIHKSFKIDSLWVDLCPYFVSIISITRLAVSCQMIYANNSRGLDGWGFLDYHMYQVSNFVNEKKSSILFSNFKAEISGNFSVKINISFIQFFRNLHHKIGLLHIRWRFIMNFFSPAPHSYLAKTDKQVF